MNILKELNKIRYLKKHGVKAIGKIIDMESSADLDGLKTYRPCIEFKTSNNRIYSFKPTDGKMSKPVLNALIPVIYDPRNPDIAIIDSPSIYRFAIFKMAIILLVFCFLTYILLHQPIRYIAYF